MRLYLWRMETVTEELSRISSIVRYDGPVLADHSMDVSDLAPALLSLSEIVKIANLKVNGDRSETRIVVRSAEQNCFQIYVDVVQTVGEYVTTLVSNEPVSTAKEIAEWIGIVSKATKYIVPVTIGVGVFGIYKWIARQKRPMNSLDIKTNGSNVEIRNNRNNGNVVVDARTFNLVIDPAVLGHAKKILEPLTRDGYDKLNFEHDREIVNEFFKEDARDICRMSPSSLETSRNTRAYEVKRLLQIKKADLLGNSKWEFILNNVIHVKIEDEDWMAKLHDGSIAIQSGCYLDVIMRIEIEVDDNGDFTDNVNYFIMEVKDIIPPGRQIGLFESKGPDNGQ